MRTLVFVLLLVPLGATHSQVTGGGGQTKANESGWTVDTFKAHMDQLNAETDRRYEQRFQASEKAIALGFSSQKALVDAALAAADRAVLKAELASEKRFESVNEFRSTLADQQRNLIPRSEVEVVIKAMGEKVEAIQQELSATRSESKGVKGGWGYAVGAMGLVVGVVALMLKGGGHRPRATGE